MSGGVSYYGSKISLISNAGIRYEGHLFSVDTTDSTVTLSKGEYAKLTTVQATSALYAKA